MVDKIIDSGQVQSSFRITLTDKVRQKLGGVEIGDTIAFVLDAKGTVCIRKAKVTLE
jgi:hypothetical protein